MTVPVSFSDVTGVNASIHKDELAKVFKGLVATDAEVGNILAASQPVLTTTFVNATRTSYGSLSLKYFSIRAGP